MNDSEKTEKILDRLMNKLTSRHRCNVLFPELRLGSGYADVAQRRIDLFMISAEKGNYTTAFEIKVSRGDFLKDIKDVLKQRGTRLYSSNFYYVAPKGMIKPEEVPMWAGLLEYDFEENQFYKRIPAPLQSRNTPSWGLICSLVRRVRENSGLAQCQEKIEGLKNIIRVYEKELRTCHRILSQLANKELDEPLADLVLNDYKHRTFIYIEV